MFPDSNRVTFTFRRKFVLLKVCSVVAFWIFNLCCVLHWSSNIRTFKRHCLSFRNSNGNTRMLKFVFLKQNLQKCVVLTRLFPRCVHRHVLRRLITCKVRLGYCFSPYQRVWLYNGAPLVAFYDTLGIRRTYSRLKPPASSTCVYVFFGPYSRVGKSCF